MIRVGWRNWSPIGTRYFEIVVPVQCHFWAVSASKKYLFNVAERNCRKILRIKLGYSLWNSFKVLEIGKELSNSFRTSFHYYSIRSAVLVGTANVWRSPSKLSSCTFEPNYATSRHDLRLGRLSIWQRYLFYRVLVYCEDFCTINPLSPRSYVGGCYMLPFALPRNKNCLMSSIQTIALTPPCLDKPRLLML